METLLCCFGFGIYTLSVTYIAWSFGRKSKWEEQMGVPPAVMPLIENQQKEKSNASERERLHSLTEG